jgi:hypothetical protein
LRCRRGIKGATGEWQHCGGGGGDDDDDDDDGGDNEPHDM